MTPTIPAVVNGHVLVRECSPVWFRDEDTPWVVLAVDGAQSLIAPVCGDCPLGLWADLDDLSLRLDDPTGRAHLAWWLLRQPRFAGHVLAMSSMGVCSRWWFRGGVHMHIATLNLNPDDPRLLPDGSRWVDAEALRRVALHVAGATPADTEAP